MNKVVNVRMWVSIEIKANFHFRNFPLEARTRNTEKGKKNKRYNQNVRMQGKRESAER